MHGFHAAFSWAPVIPGVTPQLSFRKIDVPTTLICPLHASPTAGISTISNHARTNPAKPKSPAQTQPWPAVALPWKCEPLEEGFSSPASPMCCCSDPAPSIKWLSAGRENRAATCPWQSSRGISFPGSHVAVFNSCWNIESCLPCVCSGDRHEQSLPSFPSLDPLGPARTVLSCQLAWGILPSPELCLSMTTAIASPQQAGVHGNTFQKDISLDFFF